MRFQLPIIALLAFLAVPALGDGFLVPVHQPQGDVFTVKYHHVDVFVDGQAAVTKVDQVFHNETGREEEGTYIFPLPKGATILQAQAARGLDLQSGNLFHRVGNFIPQAVPLFFYALRYANQLAVALESRGFSPASKRTLYYEPRMRRIDYAVMGVLLLILIAMVYVRLGLQLGAIFPGRL